MTGAVADAFACMMAEEHDMKRSIYEITPDCVIIELMQKDDTY